MKIWTWIGVVVGCFLLAPLKAENGSLWQVCADSLHASYAPAPMASGCIGILPGKEPFRIEQVVLNHVFDAAAPGVVRGYGADNGLEAGGGYAQGSASYRIPDGPESACGF